MWHGTFLRGASSVLASTSNQVTEIRAGQIVFRGVEVPFSDDHICIVLHAVEMRDQPSSWYRDNVADIREVHPSGHTWWPSAPVGDDLRPQSWEDHAGHR